MISEVTEGMTEQSSSLHEATKQRKRNKTGTRTRCPQGPVLSLTSYLPEPPKTMPLAEYKLLKQGTVWTLHIEALTRS